MSLFEQKFGFFSGLGYFLAMEIGIYPALLVQQDPFLISVQFSSILFISPQEPPEGVFIF